MSVFSILLGFCMGLFSLRTLNSISLVSLSILCWSYTYVCIFSYTGLFPKLIKCTPFTTWVSQFYYLRMSKDLFSYFCFSFCFKDINNAIHFLPFVVHIHIYIYKHVSICICVCVCVYLYKYLYQPVTIHSFTLVNLLTSSLSIRGRYKVVVYVDLDFPTLNVLIILKKYYLLLHILFAQTLPLS